MLNKIIMLLYKPKFFEITNIFCLIIISDHFYQFLINNKHYIYYVYKLLVLLFCFKLIKYFLFHISCALF